MLHVIVALLQTGEVKCRVSNSAEDSLTCSAWHNDGTKFYVGGTRGQFLECVSHCAYMYMYYVTCSFSF